MGYSLPRDARLKGPFQPMRFEATVDECIVTHGEIPKELSGGFYRTGPTWKRPTRQGTNGLLGMDGMVQALVLDNGRADFRNRWIRTPKYLLEERHGRGMFSWDDGDWDDWRSYGYGDRAARQSHDRSAPGHQQRERVPVRRAGRGQWGAGRSPIALDPITLETAGIVDWSPRLSPGIHSPAGYGDNAFTAHPKWDHDTGVLYGWSYRDTAPYVTVHVVHPDGGVQTRELHEAPYNTVAHDIWLTPEWMVMPFQPMLIDKARITERELSVFGWDQELPIVIALIPRHDLAAPVRYITTDLEPQYIMHTLAANVDGNTLTLDGPIFNRPPFPFEQDFAAGDDVALFFSIAKSTLGRWTVDLSTGHVKAEQLSDQPSELPKVDERFYGKGYRFGYEVGGVVKRGGMKMNSLVVTDMTTLADQEYRLRSDEPAAVLEATFAPRRPDSPEGDGYLIVPVSWWGEKRGEYQIFDTHDITQGPICRIELPFMMGWTPHGHWMDFR